MTFRVALTAAALGLCLGWITTAGITQAVHITVNQGHQP